MSTPTLLKKPSTPLQPVVSDVTWRDSFELGTGISAITGELAKKAVEWEDLSAPASNTTNDSYSMIVDQESMDRAIGGSLAGTYNMDGLTATASTTFFSAVTYSSTSMTIIASRQIVADGYQTLVFPKLSNDAAQLMKSNPATFRNAYGDYFINGQKNGSKIVIVLVCQSSNTTDQSNFQAALDSDFLDLFSGQGQTALTKAAAANRISINTSAFQTGCRPYTPPNGWSVDAISPAIEFFSKNLDPTPLQAELHHYSEFDSNYPKRIPVAPDVFTNIALLFSDYWNINARYESLDNQWQELLQTDFGQFQQGLPAQQERLGTTPTVYQRFRTLADRLYIYFSSIDQIGNEPAQGKWTTEHSNAQHSWPYGITDTSKGQVDVAPSQFYHSENPPGHHKGSLEVSLGSGIIVGWQVVSSRTDGKNGKWRKNSQTILLQSHGSVGVESEYDRSCDWTTNYFYVTPGNITT
jgi:hypothetical protein